LQVICVFLSDQCTWIKVDAFFYMEWKVSCDNSGSDMTLEAGWPHKNSFRC